MQEIFNYKAKLLYEGTKYLGWQSQKNGLGIQDILQNLIKKIWNIKIIVYGASRTDAGVHSIGQTIKFSLPFKLEPMTCQKIINSHLPSDIYLNDCQFCDEKFSPRYDAIKKLYHYNFSFKKQTPVFNPYIFHYHYTCNLEITKKTLKIFEGTHNFASFCTKPEGSTIRTINRCELFEKKYGYTVEIEGRSFLRYMVRRIVGAALTAGTKNYNPDFVNEFLQKANPSNNFYNVPAKGLILMHVLYNNEEQIPKLEFFNP